MTTDAEIEELVRGFEDCTLPKTRWTHHAHLTVALWYLRRHPREEAARRMRDGIRRYNHSVGGSPTAYHETITLAWLAVIGRFLGAAERAESDAELTRQLVAACGDRDHLLRYYSRAALFSEDARQRWVPPDLRAIDAV